STARRRLRGVFVRGRGAARNDRPGAARFERWRHAGRTEGLLPEPHPSLRQDDRAAEGVGSDRADARHCDDATRWQYLEGRWNQTRRRRVHVRVLRLVLAGLLGMMTVASARTA